MQSHYDPATLPYDIQHQEDGVYLLFTEATTEDAPLPPTLVIHDITRRGISGVKPGELVLKLRARPPILRLADAQPQKNVDSACYATVSKDGMHATMWLLPPVESGAVRTPAQIVAQLHTAWGITHGLLDEAIAGAVQEERWLTPVEIAEGISPENGADGYIDLLFETSHDRTPQQLEDGSVDYKNMNIFTSVKAGDTIAMRIAPQPGKPGHTVQGKEIPPKPGKAVALPKGKNVSPSADGNTLLADRDGRVDLLGGRVVVSDKFVVDGDVDMSVGNIRFEGDISINGGVISGLTIETTGNIEVSEVVEASTLIADGDIILKKGIQGMDKAVLKAGGSIIARFLERATAQAGGNILSDYIVHSDITAEGQVICKGKRGKLIGGVTRAGKGVTAHTLGTPTGEKTLLEIGATPALRRRQDELAERTAELKAQIEKIDSMSRIYGRKDMPTEQQAALEKLLAGKEPLQQSYDALLQELEQVKNTITKLNASPVHVYGEAFHDVKITIGSTAYTVRQTIPFATFRYRNGEISFGACDLNDRGD